MAQAGLLGRAQSGTGEQRVCPPVGIHMHIYRTTLKGVGRRGLSPYLVHSDLEPHPREPLLTTCFSLSASHMSSLLLSLFFLSKGKGNSQRGVTP